MESLAIWILGLALVVSQSCIVQATKCYSNFAKAKYPLCQEVQTGNNQTLALHWTVEAGSITFGVDLDGDWSWVGLGISEGGMLGADLWVAAHEGSQWVARDYFSEDFSAPQPDKQQDVKLVSVTRHAGVTTLELSRRLDTCDKRDRAIEEAIQQTMVFACGAGAFGYHGTANRAQAAVTLIPAATATPAAPLPALQQLDLRMPNVSLSPAPTAYTCMLIEVPADQKYHVYQYEAIIDNKALVHHMIMYACSQAPPLEQLNKPTDCLTDMPPHCESFYVGWAPGIGLVGTPPEAAYPIGAGSFRYINLQIHYNNMAGLQGQYDSSGMRLYYSSTLKQYDLGVLTLGSMSIAVPPGAPSWRTPPNLCPAACTRKHVAADAPVTLVASIYHMHLLGRSARTRHIRAGVELPPLGVRDYFRFDYQAAVPIPPATRTLLPGDELITTCTYTGQGRTNTTSFGLASYEEMCFNFLTYYPYSPDWVWCMAFEQMNATGCGSSDEVDGVLASGDVQAGLEAGYLLPMGPLPKITKPYAPKCASAGSGSSDSSGGSSGSTVAIAVLVSLALVAVGALAGVMLWRRAKARRSEEATHLLEDCNPNLSSSYP